jgi:hypothetical protein
MKYKEEVLTNGIWKSVFAIALYLQYVEAFLTKHTAAIGLTITLLNNIGTKPGNDYNKSKPDTGGN